MTNLSPAQREEKRHQLETAFNSLIDGLCSTWSNDELSQVREDIDNYEFVLALELLAAIIVEHAKPLTGSQLQEINGIAKRMNLSGNEYLRNLHRYAAAIGLKDMAEPSPTQIR
jgi:hypothetical protein